MRTSKAEREEALTRLRDLLKPGDTVTCVLRHVSRSGMYRAIDLFLVESEDGRIVKHWLSRLTAKATGLGFDERREALGMSGAGMDMGFHAVYVLSSVLFRDSFECIGDKCPSNDHSNGSPRPHAYRLTEGWDDEKRLEAMPATLRAGELRARRDNAESSGRPCTVYGCGEPIGKHPTKPQHHSDGGYALSHVWL